MSWMLGVYVRAIKDGEKAYLATQCHASIVNDKSLQDADTVLAILKESLTLFKKGHSDITEVFIRSDNVSTIM